MYFHDDTCDRSYDTDVLPSEMNDTYDTDVLPSEMNDTYVSLIHVLPSEMNDTY